MAYWKDLEAYEVIEKEDHFELFLTGIVRFSDYSTARIKVAKYLGPFKKGERIEINTGYIEMLRCEDIIHDTTQNKDYALRKRAGWAIGYLKEWQEEILKDLKDVEKENQRLKILVSDLEKIPVEQLNSQLSFYQKIYPQEFDKLERNITGRDIFMSDFISLLVDERKKLAKRIILSKDLAKNLQKSSNKFNQQLNQEKYQTNQISAELKKEKTNYYNTAINLAKERVQAKKTFIDREKIKKKSLKLENDLVNEQDKAKNLQTKITTAEQNLGTSLNNLVTELEGKTLADYKQIQERERERERETILPASWLKPKLKSKVIGSS